MNVQHLESVADAVATITGAPVNERLPDDVLQGADEIELVDMSPHALRQRMKHGNVYPPERTAVALDKFFTEGNLTALRELALRLVAQRVEGQLESTAAGPRLALVTERVVVLVDGSNASRRAVRRAAHLASALHGALIAVVVDTPNAEHNRSTARATSRRRSTMPSTSVPKSSTSKPPTSAAESRAWPDPAEQRTSSSRCRRAQRSSVSGSERCRSN